MGVANGGSQKKFRGVCKFYCEPDINKKIIISARNSIF